MHSLSSDKILYFYIMLFRELSTAREDINGLDFRKVVKLPEQGRRYALSKGVLEKVKTGYIQNGSYKTVNKLSSTWLFCSNTF